MQMMGGRSPAPLDSPSVQSAASHFMSTHLLSDALSKTNYRIVSAQQQVVAGINYYLTIEIEGVDGGCGDVKNVVVYDKFGTVSVTRVEDVGCK